MRILLLSSSEDYYSTRRLQDAFRERGHEILSVDPARLELGPGSEGLSIHHRGAPVTPFDLCLPRLSRPHLAHTARILEALEASGTLLLNPLEGIRDARDKYGTYLALGRAGLPTPPTTLVSDPDRVREAAGRLGGFPVVLKPLHATQGSGVSLLPDAASARVMLRHLLARGEGAVFQAFLKEGAGRDIRLMCVGARVLGAMQRTSEGDEFRANLHQGGRAEALQPSDALKDLASRAAGALSLRFAGVDVLSLKDGVRVLEVNASPGLQGFESATGIDVAGHVVDLAERLHDGRGP